MGMGTAPLHDLPTLPARRHRLLDSASSSRRHTCSIPSMAALWANLSPPGQAPVSDATLQIPHEARRKQGRSSTANLLLPQLKGPSCPVPTTPSQPATASLPLV